MVNTFDQGELRKMAELDTSESQKNKELELTDAIVSYDGIFKGMYDDTLRKMFQDGRKLLSSGSWEEGKKTFERALELAKDIPRDRKTLSLLVSELHRYEMCQITNGTKAAGDVNWLRVAERPIKRLDESYFELPQAVFFLNIGKPGSAEVIRLVGRKCLSDLWVNFLIPEMHCSFVTAGMILGLFVDQRLTDSQVTLYYHELTKEENLRVLGDIMASDGKDCELIHPFPLMRESTRCEWGSPPEGWVVDDAFDVMLGRGEEKIRAYSIKFLQQANLSKPILYDPACSTGVFLSTLQSALPRSYTIGQDLSLQMADFAKERVDEAHCGNAAVPVIDPGTADAVYIRFLNSEVVMTSEAENLLIALLPTVKPGGYIITFGHTPVLISSANFLRLEGFELRQCVGTDVDKTGIFQYYVIQKK